MKRISDPMQRMKTCEQAYIRCFSQQFENEQIIRYRDDQLPDMYDHNFTYLKHPDSKNTLQRLVEEEIQQNCSEQKTFFKVSMDAIPDANWLQGLSLPAVLEHSGYFMVPSLKSPQWKTLSACAIHKVVNDAMVEELAAMDLVHDRERCGEDFCLRRARRRGRVYLSEVPLDSYLCYFKGDPVGNCDLFLHGGVAKIEDFAVLPSFQRLGIGTTILKAMIDIALSNSVSLIYLVADEEDTPREMYCKLGFEKVGDSYALFGKW